MKAVKVILAAGTASLLFAVNGYANDNADQSGQQSQNRSSEMNSSEDRQNQSSDQQTVQGEIAGFRHLNLHARHGLKQSSFVRLKLSDGSDLVVDVGQKSKLDDLDLASGDQVQVSGHYREMAGRRVLVAHQIEANGQTVDIEQPEENGHRVLTGTIEGFHNLAVEGSEGEKETQTLVKLKLESGQTRIFDLGPQDRISNLGLTKGDRVRVGVEPGTLDDHSTMLVDRLDDLSHNEIANEAAGASRYSGKEMTIRGQVRGYQVWTIEENDQPAALLDLRLQNGKSVMIATDQYRPGELDLRQLELGDRVEIKAHQTDGKEGQQLVADSIRFKEPKTETSQQ